MSNFGETKNDDLETLLKPDQVAKKLQIGLSTVYHLVHRGQLPGIKIGGTLRFSPRVLARFIQDQINTEQHGFRRSPSTYRHSQARLDSQSL